MGEGVIFSRRTLIAGLSASLTACGRAGGDALVRGETGRVVSVRDGDQIALDTGLTVRLAEIEAPRRQWRDRAGDPHGEAAAEFLEYAALGRRAELSYGGLTRDRYDRALAHVTILDESGGATWLNGHLVEQGAARVRSYPDNCAQVRSLYALEEAARQAGRGLWTHQSYRVLGADDLTRDRRGLAIVQDVIETLSEVSDGASRALAGPGGGLVLELGYLLARAPDRPSLSVGQTIRLRGGARRDDSSGYIGLDHWEQVEGL